MRRNTYQGIYSYDTYADFPALGKDGYLYRSVVSNRIYLHEGGGYVLLFGGGDSPYRGQFDTLAELKAAYPTDEAGAFASVGAALYIYDKAWHPSGSVYRGQYGSLADLEADRPTDIHGALAVADGVLYVYDNMYPFVRCGSIRVMRPLGLS
jgi:hypothetical protein